MVIRKYCELTMTRLRAISGILALLGAVILFTTSALAQSGDPIKVVVGKTTLLRLEERPEVIFIGNPAYVDIIIERNDVAFLIGRQTGETSMHLLDSEGETLMHVPIVVVPEEERHVTLTRGRAETTFSCNPRCAGVPNPHAAGAAIARGQQTIAPADEGGGAGQAQDAAAATAAAAAAAAVAATQQPAEDTRPSRPIWAPVN